MRRHPLTRRVGKKYASGRFAKGQCPICGLVYPYTSFQPDWRGIYVCGDCVDVPPPPINNYNDAQTLRHPRPLLDVLPELDE